MSSVVGVCMMYCWCFQPVRQAACGLLSVTACVERCVHNIWSASPSRLTLAERDVAQWLERGALPMSLPAVRF